MDGAPVIVLMDVLIPGLKSETWGTQFYGRFDCARHFCAIGMWMPFSLAVCWATS
jgi:hypothetical protein